MRQAGFTSTRAAVVASVCILLSTCGQTGSDDSLAPSSSDSAQTTTWQVGNDISVVDVARCDNILFVLNVGRAVHRVDLTTGELLEPLAGGRVGFPLSMVVHCEGRTLYVASPSTVLATAGPMIQGFDFDSGELHGEHPLPGDFLPRPGGHVDGDSLVMAGIWGRPDPEVRAKVRTAE